MRADAQAWAAEAEQGQDALDARFVSRVERLPLVGRRGRPGGSGRMRNTSPWRLRQAFDFNYWWLAHAVEVRIDAFERSGDGRRLDQARAVYARIVKRNHGLFNDYFDDMGWLCLAALRLAEATGERAHLADAEALWEHIASRGWNTAHGPSVSWRVQQPSYKNAPSNGAFALASLRLHSRTGEQRFLDRGEAALDWMRTRLVDDRSLVLDGIGRTGGDEIDRDWIFSYNQGLLIGALTEQFDRTGDTPLLTEAAGTAAATICTLAPDGVVTGENARLDERGGGDAGLFKGIFFRHLEGLLERLADGEPGPGSDPLTPFFLEATDRLRLHLHPDPDAAGTAPHRSPTNRQALAGDDWSHPAPRTTSLATELSAVMTLEARARWEARRGGTGAGPTV
ncbi:glycoside hydrolase family 76 protein [Herbiconiux sp.]|uniref:glycoside hydrolase family 76 protein n=1 Tax=Herbiconiux sp. TaxID=1871186 RepID=UPI0025BFECA6|nr:glycoside hydrolase family 76 protein [Herbiconiux sp.]